jgi:hypothetical protein
LKVLHNLPNHWTNTIGWNMAKVMHEIVFQSTSLAMQKVDLFLFLAMK